jgi:hypothetical protein
VELRAQASVDAEKLLIHDSSQRQTAERFHASLVHFFRILVLAFQFEGEVVGQVPAFMIPAEQPKGVWIPDLQ